MTDHCEAMPAANRFFLTGRAFTTPVVLLNIPEGALFTDYVKRLKNDRCFHE